MHTQKRIFARAIMLGRVELQSDTRVTLTVEELSESNHCPLVSRERARLSRFLRALHLDATPCSFLDRGVPFSRQYILDIFIQSWMIITNGWNVFSSFSRKIYVCYYLSKFLRNCYIIVWNWKNS